MGRGIAVVFAYAGHAVEVIDCKPRARDDFERLATAAREEIHNTLTSLARFGLFEERSVDAIVGRVAITPASQAERALPAAAVIFEGVPEVPDLKREVLARASELAGAAPIIASTTSTILADDLAGAVAHPRRFLNAHWLNPAYLVPLVELAPASTTDPAVVERLKSLLEGIGKVPVVCAARPGYIVPRIQALAMNEAARMVEEGVASAADIDKAIKYGFGFRFAVLGMLEFIDWGGGDILYYASRYLTQALGDPRYAAPEIVERNMREGRIGLSTGQGFLDYDTLDIEKYRAERLKAFVAMLGHLGLTRPPVLEE
jgi:3-hydroxybutyryl-CoA dehydrogenase